MVVQHLPLLRTVVGGLAMNLPSHVDTDDLCSCGFVGRFDAVTQFYPDGGDFLP